MTNLQNYFSIRFNLFLCLSVLGFSSTLIQADEKTEPDWSGAGSYRILIRVPADEQLADRKQDERIAAVEVNFAEWFKLQNLSGQVDLSSLQLHRYDPATGEPLPGISFEGAKSKNDVPCRFEENFLMGDYPSRVGRPSETEDGRTREFQRSRKGRLFNREQASDAGKLILVASRPDEQVRTLCSLLLIF
ncbi:MAG: hypothetical protein R3C11_17995 [Planctomycetaceae bacterium]